MMKVDHAEAPIAVVTGASAGIGAGVAQRLKEDGYHVVAVARSPREATQKNFDMITADVGNVDDVERLKAEVESKYERLDALVTCAGILARDDGDRRLSREKALQQIDTNLLGTINVCQTFTDLLVQSKGSAVTVSSSLAHNPQPGLGVYAATKGAVESFTRIFATELAGHGVRVNGVRPSLVESEIWTRSGLTDEQYKNLMKERRAEYPLGRTGTPRDIAGAVSFLLSPDAEWITGVVLPVDGGSGLIGR